jgi:hypothetical protein
MLRLCAPAGDPLSDHRRALLAEAMARSESEEEFGGLLDPLEAVFRGIVASNVATSTAISVPATWPVRLREYAGTHRVDGAVLTAALERGPAFHRDGWILRLQPNAGAMTLDTDVFVRGRLSLATYAHELVHVFQYGAVGPVAFLTSYFGLSAAVIAYRLVRRQPIDAMQSSPHEAQAYALEGRFDAWHASVYGASASTVTV